MLDNDALGMVWEGGQITGPHGATARPSPAQARILAVLAGVPGQWVDRSRLWDAMTRLPNGKPSDCPPGANTFNVQMNGLRRALRRAEAPVQISMRYDGHWNRKYALHPVSD